MRSQSRILIIDSSDAARTILFKKLYAQLNDVEIIACASAKEALTAATRFEFDIITTEIDLPDMNGYQLIDKIRTTPKNKDTAIFAISSNDDDITEEIQMDGIKAVTAYFDKADEHKLLIAFISNFLQKSDILTARIIYIDNSATSAAITSSILKQNGFHYKYFKSAEESLVYIQKDIKKNGFCSYDLLITDILSNDTIIGYDLVKIIRKDYELDYLTLPILLLMPEPDEDVKTDFTGIFGAGTNDFLTKPFSKENLLERLQVLINIKRQYEAIQH